MNARERRRVKRAVHLAMFGQPYAGRRDRVFARAVQTRVAVVHKIGRAAITLLAASISSRLVKRKSP